MSSLPAEKNQVPFEKADGISPDPGSVLLDMIEWQREQRRLLDKHSQKPDSAKVQMKAAYFEEPKEEPLPKIDTIDEMATKLLKAVQGGQ